jgi:adenylate kinase
MMKINFKTLSALAVFTIFVAFSVFYAKKYLDYKKVMKSKINIVLIGAAGSGKGTQGDILKEKYNLLKMSAGDVLREYRSNPKNKHATIVNEYLNKGELLPIDLTNAIIEDYLNQNISKYNGVIFDGYPRHELQAKFLDEYLKKTNQVLDAVIYVDMKPEDLLARLQNRFSCAKCGEIYNKVAKPTTVAGVCDKCGHTHFVIREDDSDINAINRRFEIFHQETSKVLEGYTKKGLVHRFDANQDVAILASKITEKLDEVIAKK